MMYARLPGLRLVRSFSAWLAVAAAWAVALGSAWLQQRHEAAHGADRALDLYASLVLPLLVYAIVAAGVGSAGLARSGRSLVRLGAPPTEVALATVVVTALASALACGMLGASVAAWAHGDGDPPRMEDVLHVLAFGAIGGAAYAAYLILGAAFVSGWWGRVVLLVVDWAVGSGVGLGAAFTPRAHLRNLLGGEPPFDALPWESLAALATITVVCAAWAVRRASRART
jgi:hypothetical protein